VLHLVGIQHGDGVAVGHADNPDRDRLGIGGAGQRQQQAYKGFSHGGARLVGADASLVVLSLLLEIVHFASW